MAKVHVIYLARLLEWLWHSCEWSKKSMLFIWRYCIVIVGCKSPCYLYGDTPRMAFALL